MKRILWLLSLMLWFAGCRPFLPEQGPTATLLPTSEPGLSGTPRPPLPTTTQFLIPTANPFGTATLIPTGPTPTLIPPARTQTVPPPPTLTPYILVATQAPPPPVQPPPRSNEPGVTTFGAQIGAGANVPRVDTSRIQALGIRASVLWFYLSDYINPQTGRLDTSRTLAAIDQAQQASGGVELYLHVLPTHPNPKLAVPDLNTSLQPLIDLVSALRGRVHYYSLGSEISGATFAGTVDDYAYWLASSYQAIKAVDPTAVVLDSGMAGETYGVVMAREMYNQGQMQAAIDFVNGNYQRHAGPLKGSLPVRDAGGLAALLNTPYAQDAYVYSQARFTTYCMAYDVLQVHYYQAWQSLSQTLDWLANQMMLSGCRKPIQIWELGYGLEEGAPYDAADHAQATAKLLTIAASKLPLTVIYAPYVEKSTYAKGLVTNDGQLRAAAQAFQVTTNWLAGFSSADNLSDNQGTWLYRFHKSAGDVYVVWRNTPGTVNVPVGTPRAVVSDITGRTVEADPRAIQAGPGPLFVMAR